MGRLTVYLLLSFITLSCSEDSDTLNENSLIGLWVPYDIKTTDGQPVPNLIEEPFTAVSIFGFYAESIQFNVDGTYYPAVWTDKNNFFTYDKSGGNYEYVPTAKKISLTEGQWDMNLQVIKFSNDDLWITTNDLSYKLRRQNK